MAYDKDKVFDIICDRICEGESLRSVLLDDDMPTMKTINRWLNDDELLCHQYARACEIRADYIFDEMFEIADDGKNDYTKKTVQGEEVEVLNTENIQRSRLRIDTRKWALSKMNPKKYGDKIQQEHSGKIDTPEKVNLTIDGKNITLK